MLALTIEVRSHSDRTDPVCDHLKHVEAIYGILTDAPDPVSSDWEKISLNQFQLV